jgi:2-polyprenyl-6-methoxyphenol hydroxylase-like FAD-dependent oxidoreductase
VVTAGPVEFDLAVIGAGPGGCACALAAARRGLRVALFDPRADGADRPCGEGIMPEGLAVLEALGLREQVARGRTFRSLRFFLRGRPLLDVPLPAAAAAIPRPDLLSALDRALAGEASVSRFRARGEPRPAGEDFEVFADGGGTVRARALAVASGGNRSTFPSIPSNGGRPGRFGLRARYEEAGRLDEVEVHLGEGVEVYLTPLPGRRINAAFLFSRAPEGVRGSDELARWALGRHPLAAARLRAAVDPPEGRLLGLPRPRRAAFGRAFLVGDACGGVDPIVGCGVTVALRTGVFAAEAAVALRGGAGAASVAGEYETALRREVRRKRLLASLLLHLSSRPGRAKGVAGLLRRCPRLLAALARLAAGPPGDASIGPEAPPSARASETAKAG